MPKQKPSYDYQLLTLEEHQRNIIREAMSRFDGKVADAARALGVSKSTLYEKLYGFGLRKRPGRG